MLWSIDSCQKGYPRTIVTWLYRGFKCRTKLKWYRVKEYGVCLQHYHVCHLHCYSLKWYDIRNSAQSFLPCFHYMINIEYREFHLWGGRKVLSSILSNIPTASFRKSVTSLAASLTFLPTKTTISTINLTPNGDSRYKLPGSTGTFCHVFIAILNHLTNP